jgi:hypothetical protein
LTTPLEAARRALAERLGDALPVDVLRDAFLDGAVELTEAALEADRTLGGTVRWAEASPPRKALDRTLGAAVVATAEVDLTLTYESDRSSG